MNTQEYAHDQLLKIAKTCKIIKKVGVIPTYTILDYEKKTVLQQSPGIKSVIKFNNGAWFPIDSCGRCYKLIDLITNQNLN